MARFHEVSVAVTKMGLNRVVRGDINRGIITSGLTYLWVMDVLESAHSRPFVLKLGVTNPLDKEAIYDFLSTHDQILVLEELDDILENQIKALAYDRRLTPRIMGKTCDEDYMGEFTQDRVFSKLQEAWPDLLSQSSQGVKMDTADLCPECGHRSAFFAIKKALAANDVAVANIGCHTLGYMPPHEIGDVLMPMGASSCIASGLSLENTEQNVMAFIGDSTFFRPGLPDLINSVLGRQNMTLIIMENQTTTGGHAGGVIRIEDLVKALGINHVFSWDTHSQEKLTWLVKTAMATKDRSVVVARHAGVADVL